MKNITINIPDALFAEAKTALAQGWSPPSNLEGAAEGQLALKHLNWYIKRVMGERRARLQPPQVVDNSDLDTITIT